MFGTIFKKKKKTTIVDDNSIDLCAQYYSNLIINRYCSPTFIGNIITELNVLKNNIDNEYLSKIDKLKIIDKIIINLSFENDFYNYIDICLIIKMEISVLK